MRIMQGDARVIEYLNRGLRHELAAINQYWLHYRLLDNWGLQSLAKQWRKESIEEMEHADKIIDRIIYLDGFPNLQYVAPLMIGENIKEVLECDLKGEKIALETYARGRDICRKHEDYVTMGIFESLLKDEEGHHDFLERAGFQRRAGDQVLVVHVAAVDGGWSRIVAAEIPRRSDAHRTEEGMQWHVDVRREVRDHPGLVERDDHITHVVEIVG